MTFSPAISHTCMWPPHIAFQEKLCYPANTDTSRPQDRNCCSKQAPIGGISDTSADILRDRVVYQVDAVLSCEHAHQLFRELVARDVVAMAEDCRAAWCSRTTEEPNTCTLEILQQSLGTQKAHIQHPTQTPH